MICPLVAAAHPTRGAHAAQSAAGQLRLLGIGYQRNVMLWEATMRFHKVVVLAACFSPSIAAAQMSVSTFGATDAALCYENAADANAVNTDDCDQALKAGALTVRDMTATYVNRGVILNRAGRLDEALADFDKALAKDEDLAEAFLNRGNTYYLMRRYDEALDDYQTSLKHGLTKSHVAWYNIGLAYEAKKDAVKAKDAYRTALAINPDFGPAQKKLGPQPQPDQ
jgi:tetratricopeptide (TPR) repeat protein